MNILDSKAFVEAYIRTLPTLSAFFAPGIHLHAELLFHDGATAHFKRRLVYHLQHHCA